jgi:hypothetical protein
MTTFLEEIKRLVIVVEIKLVLCDAGYKVLFTQLQPSHKVTTILSNSNQNCLIHKFKFY